jgi:hypothetical protein
LTSVFDASFLFRGLVRTQLLPMARAELRRVTTSGETLIAPAILKVEFLSGLRRLE